MGNEIQPKHIEPLEEVRPTGTIHPEIVDRGIRTVDEVQELHPGCVVIIRNTTTGVTIRGDTHPKNGYKRIKINISPDS